MQKQIYLLEDDQGIREFIEFILSSEGYDVQSFSTVHSFLSRLGQRVPDLFILDIMLPDGDGLEICQDLKKSDITKDTPVIMMSANSKKYELQTDIKVEDYIAKPFDVDDFLRRVRIQLPSEL